jgi:lantibiotic leader peptide-processing serine protease
MKPQRRPSVKLAALVFLSLLGLVPVSVASAAQQAPNRYVAVAKSDADYVRLRAEILAAGGKIVRENPQINMLTVSMPGGQAGVQAQSRLAASPSIEGLARDHITQLILPEGQKLSAARPTRTRVNVNGAQQVVIPDPAFGLPGLMWNVERIRGTQSLQVQTGVPTVKVGVADTGLDYTHSELAPRMAGVVDFSAAEDPPICKEFFDGPTDKELAAETGGPADGDFNGHGSWIGGNIAAALNDKGINGIAPNIRLVSLKISQWCGAAYDSTILGAFLYAAEQGIDVVSISFGGYLDRADPEQDLIYRAYVRAVRYARQRGTVIVASAGNEHLRVGDGGKVLSHGSLTAPGGQFVDYFGQYQVPGGVPGVVDVSSTNNIVGTASNSCTPANSNNNNATCKPTTDAHQPIGNRLQNQLTYYSNYGPRIDIAAPGGARKFNLPAADRGGTPGWPWTTADGFVAFQDFSITSNYAFGIPCFVFGPGGPFPPNECYSTIQGTSMAAPHVSAVLALLISQYPNLKGHPNALVQRLKARAQPISGNLTPPLSATDTSPGDLTNVACPTGYCHLGGTRIPDAEAYGAGLVDAFAAVRPRARGNAEADD